MVNSPTQLPGVTCFEGGPGSVRLEASETKDQYRYFTNLTNSTDLLLDVPTLLWEELESITPSLKLDHIARQSAGFRCRLLKTQSEYEFLMGYTSE